MRGRCRENPTLALFFKTLLLFSNTHHQQTPPFITHTGWLVPPTTQAYEFGLDSDDGSDFAISFNKMSWDVAASWCACGACKRGWPLSLCLLLAVGVCACRVLLLRLLCRR